MRKKVVEKKIKVIQYGLGPVGQRITQFLLERNQIEIVGAVDCDTKKLGKDLGELCNISRNLGIKVTNKSKELLCSSSAEVVILSTVSDLKKILPQIEEIISAGKNIVSTCEELSYPWITNPEISRSIDNLAKEKNVSVLGTGVNPGFLMDFFPVALSGICRQVKKVKVSRVQNAELRRLPFQKKIGAGLTVDIFHQKKKKGILRHVGLTESMHMIASAFGWKLDKTEGHIEPIVAQEKISGEKITVESGQVAGISQTGRAYIRGKEVIVLEFRASLGENEPRDSIYIEGEPNIELTIKDGINGDIATCSITVNAIPVVMRALPGLKTMLDISPVSFFEEINRRYK